jgi:LacI family transcriptional regulator
MSKKRVKLVDIAEALNVSVGLVSLVLSGKAKENRISDAVSQKVIEKAKELGYRANQMARGLRTGKSNIIGLIVADIANPYFGKMARFVENEAAKLGYQVMFGSSDENPDKLNDLINVFLSRQVDGTVIVPVTKSEKHLEALKKQAFPFVFIDRYCAQVPVDAFCTDNFLGAYQLCDLLIKKGYKKIGAIVYDSEISNNTERIRGYTSALKQHNLYEEHASLIFRVRFEHFETRLESIIKDAIEKKCEALFFANNSLGVASIKLFDKMGIKIPDDLGMVSFDNPESFQVAKPAITCMEQPIEQMCRLAIGKLVDLIENKQNNQEGTVLLPASMIVRNSC